MVYPPDNAVEPCYSTKRAQIWGKEAETQEDRKGPCRKQVKGLVRGFGSGAQRRTYLITGMAATERVISRKATMVIEQIPDLLPPSFDFSETTA